jgi:hypothetical protein
MVPVGALFREADSWAVFLVKEGRAQIALVQIGHRNSRVARKGWPPWTTSPLATCCGARGVAPNAVRKSLRTV